MGGCGNAVLVQFSNEPLLHRHPPTPPHLPLLMGWRGADLLKHYTFIFYSSSNILPSSPHPTSTQSIELNLSVLYTRIMSWLEVGCGHEST